MRIHCLLFSVFFAASNGILLYVAALDPSDAPSSGTTAAMAEKLSESNDSAVDVRETENRGRVGRSIVKNAIQKFVTLLEDVHPSPHYGLRRRQQQIQHTKRQGQQYEMARHYTFQDLEEESLVSKIDSGKAANTVYIDREDVVFESMKSIALDPKEKHLIKKAVRDLEFAAGMLAPQDETFYARIFDRMMAHDDIKSFAESVQKFRFHQLITDFSIRPSEYKDHLRKRSHIRTDLPEDGPLRRAYEAFASEFAAIRGPSSSNGQGDTAKYTPAMEEGIPEIRPYHYIFDQ